MPTPVSRKVSSKADRAHYEALLNGCILEAADLDAVLGPPC